MTNNSEDEFDKIFTEMVSSDDLKEIKEEFEAQINFGLKELTLIQQSLADATMNVANIMLMIISEKLNIFGEDNIYHNLLSSLYKISEDFNECMLEYFEEDGYEIIIDEEENGFDEQ